MKATLFSIGLMAATVSIDARAGLATLNATCPGNLEVHVDQGGPVFINGKEARLKPSNENYYEATDATLGVTISISNNADGTSDVSYTGKNRAHGVCQIVKSGASAAAPATASRETHPLAEKNCLAAVAKTVNKPVGQLAVIEALGAEAGVLVTVKVPDADAPWSCQTDKKEHPTQVIYTGSEGAL